MDENETPAEEHQTPAEENETQTGEHQSNRKPRLIILGVSGLLLVGALGSYFWFNSTKIKEPDIDNAPSMAQHPKGKPPAGVNVASSVNVGPGLNGAKGVANGATGANGGAPIVAGLNGAKGVVGSTTGGGANVAAIGGAKVVAGQNNGVNGTVNATAGGLNAVPGPNGAKGAITPAAGNPNVVGGINAANPNLKSPNTAAVPGAIVKPVGPVLAAGQLRPGVPVAGGATPTAVKPGVVAVPNQSPNGIKPGTGVAAVKTPTQPNKLATANPAANKPNGAPLPPALAKPPGAAAALKVGAAAAAGVAAAAAGAVPAAGAAGAAAAAGATPAAGAAAAAGAASVAANNSKVGVDPTSDEAAAKEARNNVGRSDPMQPLTAYLPFPRNKKYAQKAADDAMVPPPPPETEDAKVGKEGEGVGALGKAKKSLAKSEKMEKLVPEKLVPPPPPTTDSLSTGGLPFEQLPVPPSKPTIGDKMQVLGVIDNKVILTFPHTLSIKNRWPRTLTLATGQEFESIKVVSITRDGVTIEEDGERTLKPLPTIK